MKIELLGLLPVALVLLGGLVYKETRFILFISAIVVIGAILVLGGLFWTLQAYNL